MFPADRKHKPLTIEYDCYKGRSSKTFDTPHKAKAFYVSKFRADRCPTITRSDVMTKKTSVKKATVKKTSTKKATTKKGTKKANVKKTSTKKSTAKKTTPAKVQSGLSKNEVKVLKALKGTSKTGKMLNRQQLGKATGINGGWAKLLGANKDSYGVQGGGLAGQGLIAVVKDDDGSRLLSYYVMANGIKALAKATK